MESFTNNTNNLKPVNQNKKFNNFVNTEYFKQENNFNIRDNKFDNQTFNKNYSENTVNYGCIIGKRVKHNSGFGENSEQEIIEETEEDGEGKKAIFKRSRYDNFDNFFTSNKDYDGNINKAIYEQNEREFLIESPKYDNVFTGVTFNSD